MKTYIQATIAMEAESAALQSDGIEIEPISFD